MAGVISLKSAKLKKHKRKMNPELVEILGEEPVLNLVEFYESYARELEAKIVQDFTRTLQDLQKATGTDGKFSKS